MRTAGCGPGRGMLNNSFLCGDCGGEWRRRWECQGSGLRESMGRGWSRRGRSGGSGGGCMKVRLFQKRMENRQ